MFSCKPAAFTFDLDTDVSRLARSFTFQESVHSECSLLWVSSNELNCGAIQWDQVTHASEGQHVLFDIT